VEKKGQVSEKTILVTESLKQGELKARMTLHQLESVDDPFSEFAFEHWRAISIAFRYALSVSTAFIAIRSDRPNLSLIPSTPFQPAR